MRRAPCKPAPPAPFSTRMRRAAIVIMVLAIAVPAFADEHGYVGEDDPWVVAAGAALRRRAADNGDGVTSAGATLRIGRAVSTSIELRGGVEASVGTTGALTVSAGVAVMPLSLGRLSLGIEAELGAFTRWDETATGALARVGPLITWRPFAMATPPTCPTCSPRNVHVPVQLELVPIDVDLVRGDGVRLGVALRIARRY
ncbi:MAG: hypothetical protein K8W52_44890 [Deltaproteobacteria bacterium]|nr:hypothetical protein [Deltaproteobacteria bacterium]